MFVDGSNDQAVRHDARQRRPSAMFLMTRVSAYGFRMGAFGIFWTSTHAVA
jgi:hypothetical protein